jgi:hypothetical protein
MTPWLFLHLQTPVQMTACNTAPCPMGSLASPVQGRPLAPAHTSSGIIPPTQIWEPSSTLHHSPVHSTRRACGWLPRGLGWQELREGHWFLQPPLPLCSCLAQAHSVLHLDRPCCHPGASFMQQPRQPSMFLGAPGYQAYLTYCPQLRELFHKPGPLGP